MRDDRRKVKVVVGKVGEYRIGVESNRLSIALTYKPNWFRRMFVKLFLGAEWVDYDTLKDKPILNVSKTTEIEN